MNKSNRPIKVYFDNGHGGTSTKFIAYDQLEQTMQSYYKRHLEASAYDMDQAMKQVGCVSVANRKWQIEITLPAQVEETESITK